MICPFSMSNENGTFACKGACALYRDGNCLVAQALEKYISAPAKPKNPFLKNEELPKDGPYRNGYGDW